MKKSTIYSNQSQELLRVFEEAGNNSKMMCVPIDFAKKDHIVMFCNGYGDIVRKPFSVNNSAQGVNIHHVFFGGEDVGSYAENFVDTLRTKGWLVAGVNAHDAKKQRANIQAARIGWI